MKKPNPEIQFEAALHIVDNLNRHGFQAVFAGGWVRDYIMKTPNKGDVDIATNATPSAISNIFPQTVGVGEQFGVMIVVEEGIPFEVATFRSDVGIKDGRHPEQIVFSDLKTDALRRDFTINGMFFNPFTEEVIDYTGGQRDIERGVIRAIGEPARRFDEDYLRMMRAIRFGARFEFDIEEKTYEAVKIKAEQIKAVSPERIFAEMDKMLRQPNPDRALILLRDTGLLKQFLPEAEELSGIEQPPEFHPEGDVFTHTVNALKFMPENPSSALAWSVLLHDIGKPPTMTISDRIRFNNHSNIGAQMSERILRRFRAPNVLIETVSSMVANHMNFMNVPKMRLSTLKRFLSRHTIQEEMELHRADCLASHGELQNYYFLKTRLGELKAEQIKPRPFLSGKDLIDLGFHPGPLFGKILADVYDLQLEDQVNTRDEAIEAVKKRWKK
ncbi:MAG: CCA tRNA nucleotidyltransferase [Chitinispirillaceae bacterium]